MSTGISIYSEPDVVGALYCQHLAIEFENINEWLKEDGCDLSPFLYCPESFMDEGYIEVAKPSDEEIAYMKVITSDDCYPISEVFSKLKKALELSAGYDEKVFERGKEHFVNDLKEMIEALTPHADSDLEVQLLRG